MTTRCSPKASVYLFAFRRVSLRSGRLGMWMGAEFPLENALR